MELSGSGPCTGNGSERRGAHSDDDGEVPVERPREEGGRQPSDVGVGPEAVRREALEARNEGDGGRERDSDQLHQIQMTSGSSV